MSPGTPVCTLLSCGHDGAADGDARGQDQERPPTSGAASASTSRGCCAAPGATAGQSGTDPGEPVQDAGPDRGRGEAALKGEVLVPAARRRSASPGRCRTGTSPPCTRWPARSACPRCSARPAPAGPGPGHDRVEGRGARLEAVTLAWWGDVTLGPDLGVEHAATDEAYAAMDWLAPAGRDRAQARPPDRPRPRTRPGWRCSTCPARGWRAGAARWGRAAGPGTARRARCRSSTGCSPTPRAGSRGPGLRGEHRRPDGVHRDPRCRARRVRAAQDGDGRRPRHDPTARIEALKELDPKYGWITALRAPAIRKLMADDGPLQLSLFDEQDLAEISSPDFPGERLVACRNPALAEQRARKREDLLAATEKALAPIAARVAAGRLAGAAAIGAKVGEVIGTRKMAKHFEVTITDDSLTIERSRRRSTTRPGSTGSTSSAPPSPPATSTPPAWSPPTRTSSTSSAISGTSNPTTWTCARSPPARETRQGPRAGLHARRLPDLAPAPGLGAADLHRRGTPRPGKPRRPRAALGIRPGQGLPAARRGRPPLPQLPRAARPPGHPDP